VPFCLIKLFADTFGKFRRKIKKSGKRQFLAQPLPFVGKSNSELGNYRYTVLILIWPTGGLQGSSIDQFARSNFFATPWHGRIYASDGLQGPVLIGAAGRHGANG
jgi:hypothetical protein